jgi:hypothetical protein
MTDDTTVAAHETAAGEPLVDTSAEAVESIAGEMTAAYHGGALVTVRNEAAATLRAPVAERLELRADLEAERARCLIAVGERDALMAVARAARGLITRDDFWRDEIFASVNNPIPGEYDSVVVAIGSLRPALLPPA